jgi:hypothetical protein
VGEWTDERRRGHDDEAGVGVGGPQAPRGHGGRHARGLMGSKELSGGMAGGQVRRLPYIRKAKPRCPKTKKDANTEKTMKSRETA